MIKKPIIKTEQEILDEHSFIVVKEKKLSRPAYEVGVKFFGSQYADFVREVIKKEKL